MIKTLLILGFIILQLGFSQQSTVQPFLPNIFNQFSNVRDLTISSTEDEAYFSAQSPMGEISVIMKITKEKGKWTSPRIASFSGKDNDLEPFISPDELKLYFASNRLTNKDDKKNDYNIWYVQRDNKNSAWSAPVNVGAPINTEHNEFYPSLSKNRNMYFTSDPPTSKGKDDIYFSKWQNNSYTSPISLSDSINSEGYEFNAYIAPDESYLLYSGYNRKDGLGSGDLYISYNKDNSWSKAKNLGEKVNSKQMDYCPYINSKTNTLFFTSKRSEITKKENGFSSLAEFLEETNKSQNGLSRIYSVPFQE